ncbi:MAG: DUF2314 domain-containing protein [Hyphomicrobiales bacterium]|nr:MAG: DUF2314 domain-containing protein [Hyphomicrobiales bacterium]
MPFPRLKPTGLALAVAAAVVVAAPSLRAPGIALAQDKTIDFSSDDQAMNAAIQKARGNLGSYWKSFASPGPGERDFFLKVAIPYGQSSGREHFWLRDIARDGDRIVGTIDNDPNHATHVHRGQRYTFGEADITDWMFRRNGKIVGAETLRVMLPKMPKAQADGFRAQLEAP